MAQRQDHNYDVAACGIHHVSVRVDDLDAALDFYEVSLGCQRIDRPDGLPGTRGAWLSVGGAELHLTEHPLDDFTGAPPNGRVGYANHVAFVVSDLDRVGELLLEKGCEVTSVDARSQLFVQDPAGNLVELMGAIQASNRRR
jgi:catechol 2,3-dioxygenase-like lactoylglutathione lyase family enzyme